MYSYYHVLLLLVTTSSIVVSSYTNTIQRSFSVAATTKKSCPSTRKKQDIFGIVRRQRQPLLSLLHSHNLEIYDEVTNPTQNNTNTNNKKQNGLYAVNLENSIMNRPTQSNQNEIDIPSSSSITISESFQRVKNMLFPSSSSSSYNTPASTTTSTRLKKIVQVGSTHAPFSNHMLYQTLEDYLYQKVWLLEGVLDNDDNTTGMEEQLEDKTVRILEKENDGDERNVTWTHNGGVWIQNSIQTLWNEDEKCTLEYIQRQFSFGTNRQLAFIETKTVHNNLTDTKQYQFSTTSTKLPPLLSPSTRVEGCTSTVHIQTLLIPTYTTTTNQNHYTVLLNGTSDALLSRGLIAILSNVCSTLTYQDIVALRAGTITDELGIRDLLTKGRNDGIANIVNTVQSQIQSLLVTSPSESIIIPTTYDSTATASPPTTTTAPKKVAMLLSGGVDSSVALHLLHNNPNYNVTAFYLKIWLEDELSHLNECPWEDDIQTCQIVCQHANSSSAHPTPIPLQILSLQKEYKQHVLEYTIQQAERGLTPNPDVMCNSRIKFGVFLDYIFQNMDMDFDFIATGHYAQLFQTTASSTNNDTIYHLQRSKDDIKDQSYFLSTLSQYQLSKLLFPIGKYTKQEVRYIAQNTLRLPNADRKDSQGLCFLGKVSFQDFLQNYLTEKKGEVINIHTRKVIGHHNGLWFFTIGQRKGMGKVLYPKVTNLGPWYVVAKDLNNNTLLVSNQYDKEQETDDDDDTSDSHQLILSSRMEFTIDDIHWITNTTPSPPGLDELSFPPQRYFMKIRHGPTVTKGTFYPATNKNTSGKIILDIKDKGLAPGQFVVFYKMERVDDTNEEGNLDEIDTRECLGAGVISEKHWALFL